MFKTLTGIAAAATLAIAAVAAPQPAQAGNGWWVGPAVGGFAAGAIVGSAVARPYPYYGYAYAPGPYYGGCYWTRHRVATPYGWRWSRVRVCR